MMYRILNPFEATTSVGSDVSLVALQCSRAVFYQKGLASWYGEYHHGRPMANGKPYDMYGYTVAHKELPLGTKVCIRNPNNDRVVFATVTDRGPYVFPRVIDLSKKIAQDLQVGVGQVEIYRL